MKLTLLNYLNVICFTANVVITYGVGVLGLGGLQTNGELSEKYQTLVTPIGFAFAIWGVIFIAQFIFTVAQLFPSYRGAPLVAKAIGYDYVGVCLSQIAWTLAFSYEIIWLSFLSMLSILYFLLSTVNDQYKLQEATPIRDYLFLKFPFSIHCGWIIAASFVNLSVLLVDVGVSLNVQYYVALATLVCLIACACFCVSFPTRPEYVVPAVLAWAAVSTQLNLPLVSSVHN
jgi:benzodiazapine receptor